jgi:hypothetical protein
MTISSVGNRADQQRGLWECRRYKVLVSWAVPLLHATDPLRKNDLLASNLLFAFLTISIGEQLIITSLVRSRGAVSPHPIGAESLWVSVAVWAPLLLGWATFASVCYAVQKGKLWAKFLVLALFLWRAGSATFLPGYILAGVPLNRWPGSWQLLILFKIMLNLAALILMFKKPQAAPHTAHV